MSTKVWVAGEEVDAADLNETIEDTRQGIPVYGVDAGSTDAYEVTFTPPITALTDGLTVRFKPNTTNGGECTMDPDGLGAIPILKNKTQKPGNGDLPAGRIVTLVYDATQTSWQLDSPALEPQTGYPIIMCCPNPSVNDAGLGSGFSDATTKLITMGMWANGASTRLYFGIAGVATDFGIMPYVIENVVQTRGAGNFGTAEGAIRIGSDYIFGHGSTNLNKNGTDVTISGTARKGPLGHDPTNSYLLVLYDTTHIARFSGIAGTTFTNIASDITLSNAITAGLGFFFDNLNTRYIGIDTSANLIRRFDSSGTQIDTAAYTFNDTYAIGVVPINGRVHVLLRPQWYVGAPYMNIVYAVPTTMVL